MLTTILGFGFVLGLRHALDPDHVVAVATIVSEHRSVGKSSIVGTLWGLGHTTSLLAAGIAVIVLKLGISEDLALWMEIGVALMLVLLGIKAVRQALRGWTVHIHRHSHGGPGHIHIHVHRPQQPHAHHHPHLLGPGIRPFLVGAIQGLAGSAGLMILVLGTIPSAVAGLVSIAMFGLGSVGGMLLMSSVISLPFALTAKRFTIFNGGLQVAAGLGSIACGLFWVWQTSLQAHLF